MVERLVAPAPPTAAAPVAGWAALGSVGAVGLAATGTRVGSVADPAHPHWWFSLPAGSSPALTHVAFYLAALALVAAWLGVGVAARRGQLTVRGAWALLALWGIPLFLGPPLFSRDLYSYIAQGLLAHHGFDPYAVNPSSLGPGPLFSSIASVWRFTTAPYGPLFIGASRGAAAAAGRSLVTEVLAFRAVELVGVALVMWSLPRLARRLGTDPGMALWLGALSPLALFSYVASGHNDALMIGLLLAGVSLALDDRLVPGLALCALAAMIKLPAAAAVVFLAVERAGREHGRRRRVVVAESVLVPVGTVVAVTTAVGFGWAWLGPTALHIPTELHVLSTPAVSIGVLVFHVLHPLGVPLGRPAIVSATQLVCAVAAVGGVLWLVRNAQRVDVVRLLGLSLFLVVLGGPTVWPWYLMWGLSLLAATPAQRSRVLAAVAALAMLVVNPSGNPLLVNNWYLAVTLVVVVGAVWLVRGGHWRSVAVGAP